MAGNLSIARSRQSVELKTLKQKRDSVASSIDCGGVSAGGFQRPRAETEALRLQLKEIDRLIKEVSELKEDEIIKRFDPDMDDKTREAIRGDNLVHYLNRGAYY